MMANTDHGIILIFQHYSVFKQLPSKFETYEVLFTKGDLWQIPFLCTSLANIIFKSHFPKFIISWWKEDGFLIKNHQAKVCIKKVRTIFKSLQSHKVQRILSCNPNFYIL